jgi:DNA-binding transcriptional regulator PaaX
MSTIPKLLLSLQIGDSIKYMIKLNKKQKKEKSIRNDYSKRKLVKEILKGLAIGGLIVASFALPGLPQIFSLLGINNAKDRYRIKRAVEALKNQKLINIYKKDGEQVVEITEKGEKRVLKYKFDEMKIERPKKWDRCWHIVSFDIPEKHKRGRDALTRKLKEIELYPLQKSVFICPFECRDEIDFIGEIFNIRKFIHYFMAKEIDVDDEEYLRKYFNL